VSRVGSSAQTKAMKKVAGRIKGEPRASTGKWRRFRAVRFPNLDGRDPNACSTRGARLTELFESRPRSSRR